MLLSYRRIQCRNTGVCGELLDLRARAGPVINRKDVKRPRRWKGLAGRGPTPSAPELEDSMNSALNEVASDREHRIHSERLVESLGDD